MRSSGQILSRVGAGLAHALLNTVAIVVTGTYVPLERLGRQATLESGEALLLAAIVVVLGTITFWLVPVRRRLVWASIVTVAAVGGGAAGLLLLGSNRAGEHDVAGVDHPSSLRSGGCSPLNARKALNAATPRAAPAAARGRGSLDGDLGV